MQRIIGNQAVGRFIQAKLKVDQPGDIDEQEADHVADQFMRMSDQLTPATVQLGGPPQIPRLQRKCAQCEEEETQGPTVRRKANSPATTAGLEVSEDFVRGLGAGQALVTVTRAFFEPRLGHDLSQVRVHTGANAAKSARAVNALAYTLGRDVVFGAGQYAPQTGTGRQLLAHELTHTLQQSSGARPAAARLQRTLGDGHDLASPRFAGDLELEACFDNERLIRVGAHGNAVVAIQQALLDLGFALPKFGADGEFGSETRRAVQQYQASRGLDSDGIVGPLTIGRLDAELPGPLPQVGPPGTAPAPPTALTPQQQMNNANSAAIGFTAVAAILVAQLRDRVNRGLPLTDPVNANTLRAVQAWLHINIVTDSIAGFLSVLDRATALMLRNIGISATLVQRVGNQPRFNCVPSSRATADIGDPNGVINCCDNFFTRGPQCQRNVVIHERFHLAGVAHGLNPDGSPRTTQPVATTTSEEALNNADDLMDLVKDVTGQQIFVCNTAL